MTPPIHGLMAASLLTLALVMSGGLDARQPGARWPQVTPDAALTAEGQGNGARARDAFMKAYPVFMHPRCQNCHPVGDTPLQGEDSHVHDLLRLRRGADGNGVFAMRCSNCHQASNGPGPHTPPGAPQVNGALPAAPRWHLPPPETPMVFQGRSPGQLCRQLRDPKQNGQLTPEFLVHHVATDPLVLWAWSPGEGRTTPPMTHDEFVAAVKSWLDEGGDCPP